MRFWVGGYSLGEDGEATGIGVLEAGDGPETSGGALRHGGDAVAVLGSPSWVTVHPTLDVVYAAHESEGVVRAYRRTGESTLAPFGDPVVAGETVCHVAVAPHGAALVASCWGDGQVVRMPLDAAGRLGTPRSAAAAVDPYGPAREDVPGVELTAAASALRQAAGAEFAHLVPFADAPEEPAEPSEDARPSRAHQAVHLPGGLVATTDMGLDLVRFWQAARMTLVQEVVLPLGSGPRHMVWHPSGHFYVVTELSHEVFVLVPDAEGTWGIVSATPLVGALPDDTAAEIAMSRRAEFLYAGVRGSNTIAVLRVRGAGETLQHVALEEAGVDWPRHHLVVDDSLLIAGERSSDVVSRWIDDRTGVPGAVRHRVAVPSPTCLIRA